VVPLRPDDLVPGTAERGDRGWRPGGLPACPDAGTAGDGDHRAALETAAAAWHALVPSLAGAPRVRVSWDRSRTYAKGRYGSIVRHDPAHPVTIPLYDAAAGTGRMIGADLDIKRAGGPDPAGQVAREAAAIAVLAAAAGGRCITDVSPGGRHVYILFAVPQPWTALRDMMRALARRFPAVDPAPACSPDGQISPPGSRHKSGGWRVLDGPLADARTAVEHPCGPQVWDRLTAELAGELAAVAPGAAAENVAAAAAADRAELAADISAPGRGRRPLSAALDAVARTGRWAGRYPTPSEARIAVLDSAAARGWSLADVQAAISRGTWAGLASLYPRPGEPGRMERLLPAEYQKAAAFAGRGKRVRNSDTSDNYHHPPPYDLGAAITYGVIRQWLTVTDIASGDRARTARWGRQAVSVRLVLTALGLAAMVSGSPRIAFGVRNLALRAGLSADTVAAVLAMLRDEPDPLIRLTRPHRLDKADTYDLVIPAAYETSARWRRRRAGLVDAVHPAFLAVGTVEALVYQALTTAEETGREVARSARLSASATADALRVLAEHGLAERGPGGWRRGPASLDDVADATGATQIYRDRAGAYAEDRAIWHETIAGWLAPKPGPAAGDDPPLPIDDVLPQMRLPLDDEHDRAPPALARA